MSQLPMFVKKNCKGMAFVHIVATALMYLCLSCSSSVPKRLPASFASEMRTPVPYELDVSFQINDHSYIFTETSYSERENFVVEAATELLGHLMGPRVDESPASKAVVNIDYKLELDKLTWAWIGETTIKVMDRDRDLLLLEEAKTGQFVFYRSIPNSSKSTQYNIIFNTMADCVEPMLPEIRRIAMALSSGNPIASKNFEVPHSLEERDNGTTEDVDEFGKVAEKELQDEFEYIKYIAKKRDTKGFKKLTVEGKQHYLRTFWAQFQRDSTVIENKFRRDYLSRVKYANDVFREGVREGWKSERGRVLLIYGRPDQLERFPSSSGQKAYEVWYYYSLDSGAEFYFVDVNGLGQLKLVNSTARGEVRDDRWTRLLEPGRAIF